MQEKISVLLVEDTRAIATEVYDYLEQKGMLVDYAETGKTALALLESNQYDVIILDLMLPDISGIQVCQHLKQNCDPVPPVLMLTARDSIQDKYEGFDAGADDYLTKPFSLLELEMRCKALSRRRTLHQSQQIIIGDLVINQKQQTAHREGQLLKLSQTDFAILMLFVDAYPNAVSRQQIIDKVWGTDIPDSDVLRSHIYTLRQQLDKPYTNAMIKTIHGIGFRLVPPDSQ